MKWFRAGHWPKFTEEFLFIYFMDYGICRLNFQNICILCIFIHRHIKSSYFFGFFFRRLLAPFLNNQLKTVVMLFFFLICDSFIFKPCNSYVRSTNGKDISTRVWVCFLCTTKRKRNDRLADSITTHLCI